MPFFVGALNALYSFQFYLVRLWVVLLGANVRIFSFGQTKREENVSETMFLFGKYGYFCGEKKEKNMTIPYDSIEEDTPNMASEPQVTYGNATQFIPRPYSNKIPEGFMTLERFGELFHQKLDACYARLQSNINSCFSY